MRQLVGRAVLVISGLGFPLTQLVIRRFGGSGAVVVQAVCGGLLVRDAALIATGVPGRLRRGPAALLWLEAMAGSVAVVAGLRAAVDGSALLRARGRQPADGTEIVRRLSVGALFGLHTLRFRIYLRPDSGRRLDAEPDTTPLTGQPRPGQPLQNTRPTRRRP